MTVNNHRTFRRFEVFYYMMSLTLVVYAITMLNQVADHPKFQCRNGLCNSVYNLIELLIMIRLFPIIMIVSQYFFAFLYLACCMCSETTERIGREQRLP